MSFIVSFMILYTLYFTTSVDGVAINIYELLGGNMSRSFVREEESYKTIIQNLRTLGKQMNEISEKLEELSGSDNAFIQECPNEWISYNDSCYAIGAEKLNYDDAMKYCCKLGAHLVNIETAEENSFLKYFFETIEGGQTDASFVLGIKEDVDARAWVWQHCSGAGDVAIFLDWGPSEPHVGTTEGCVWSEQIKNYQWSDVECRRVTKPLCEKKKSLSKRA